MTVCGPDGIEGGGDGDCDDGDASVFPGAPEACDVIDSDCDGTLVDEFGDLDGDDDPDCTDPDADGDGSDSPADCDDGNPSVNPAADELCDGLDNDCDASTDENLDDDGDGYSLCGAMAALEYPLFPDAADCDDGETLVNPEAAELCGDGIDNDCDPTTDETVDTDGDGVPDYRVSCTATVPAWASIQDAIDAASDGDVVCVEPGIHYAANERPGLRRASSQGVVPAEPHPFGNHDDPGRYQSLP